MNYCVTGQQPARIETHSHQAIFAIFDTLEEAKVAAETYIQKGAVSVMVWKQALPPPKLQTVVIWDKEETA